MKKIETMTRTLILILNLVMITSQLLSKFHYFSSMVLNHLMLLLPELLASKCHFFTLIASLDTRCFEDEDVFTEGAVEGSRGKPFPFSLNTGRSVFSGESYIDKYYSSILGIC